MSDQAVFIVVILAVALLIIGLLVYVAGGLIVMFTVFVGELPLILTVLLFILFPPSLILYLIGLAIIFFTQKASE